MAYLARGGHVMSPGGEGGVLFAPAETEAVRVRLGAAADTAPDILRVLATDPSVTVRAAVAMNPATTGDTDHMLAHDRDERVRTLLARKLANLVPGLAAHDQAALRERALATLHRLVNDEAVRVREAMADVLKDMPQAPRSVILLLARDTHTQVFDPVVRLSPILSSEDLLALLSDSPGEELAISVASRPSLAEEVADAVASGSNVRAITALLANSTAAIRESTLDMLAAEGARHEAWHHPLVTRPRLSERAARALSDYVATHLLDVLAGRADLPVATARELRQRLDARLNPPPARQRRDPDIDEAMQEARQLQAQHKLDEAALMAAVQRGEPRMATAILAVAAEVPASVVDRAATLRSAKGLISLVWKAGFSMQVAVPLQTLLARLNPGSALRPSTGGGFPLAVDEMRWQLDFLRDMGR
jgi:uncharacterized protein (DUF2336 family)